jgi:cytosine deaminase
MGCDVVGAIGYQDTDTRQHLDLTAALAREFDAPLDVHADFGVPVERSALATIAQVAEDYGLQGRVPVGHATTLRAMDYALRERTMAHLAGRVSRSALPRTGPVNGSPRGAS